MQTTIKGEYESILLLLANTWPHDKSETLHAEEHKNESILLLALYQSCGFMQQQAAHLPTGSTPAKVSSNLVQQTLRTQHVARIYRRMHRVFCVPVGHLVVTILFF